MVGKQTKKETKRLLKKAEVKLWKEVRLACIERDGGCVICGSRTRMSAHHLVPREIKELKYELDNLITLCPLHHKFSLLISPHRNPLSFVAWLYKNRMKQFDRLQAIWETKVTKEYK
jgi:5-methylcytosine-specific restriction endonuclease McrA